MPFVKKGLMHVVEIILAKTRTFTRVQMALLATVCNEPEILRFILKSKSDTGKAHILRYTLLDTYDTLCYTGCSEILKITGVNASKK